MNNGTKTSLALDNGVRDTHLTAEGGEENDQLNRIDVMSDQNQRSLLVLHQADNVVQTVLDIVGLLAHVLFLLAIGHSGSLLVQTLLLLDLGLGTVFVEELEGLGGRVTVQGVLELGNGRRNLETDAQDLLLTLELDVFGPFDEARQVALGLDVLADAKVTGASFDEGVLYGSFVSR